jgi:hypothetical protein
MHCCVAYSCQAGLMDIFCLSPVPHHSSSCPSSTAHLVVLVSSLQCLCNPMLAYNAMVRCILRRSVQLSCCQHLESDELRLCPGSCCLYIVSMSTSWICTLPSRLSCPTNSAKVSALLVHPRLQPSHQAAGRWRQGGAVKSLLAIMAGSNGFICCHIVKRAHVLLHA